MYSMDTPLKDSQSYYKDKIFPCEAIREHRQYIFLILLKQVKLLLRRAYLLKGEIKMVFVASE